MASRELGHSYVGPEHLLIGCLVEEDEGIAGAILRRYGLTPQALRQQIVKVVGRGAEDGRVDEPTNTPNLDKICTRSHRPRPRWEVGPGDRACARDRDDNGSAGAAQEKQPRADRRTRRW